MPAVGNAGFSLRRRLLWRLLVPLLILFALSGAASYVFALHFANSVYDDWLYDSVNSLALEVQQSGSGVTLDLSESAQHLFEWDAMDITYFAVRGARSGLIGGNAELPAAPADAAPLRAAWVYDAHIEAHPVRAVVLRLPAGKYGEAVSVAVAETLRKRNALAREILLTTLLPQAVLIVVAGLLIWLGVRRGLAPLRDVALRLEAQSHRRLEPIADANVPKEVRPLTRALNDLLQRLDAALISQRRFIADAAHQLRTPLTALKLHLEQARAETTLEGVQPVLSQLRIAIERAARLSNQLLTLARTEPEAAAAQNFAEFDLVVLAQATGAEWVPRALAKRIDLGFSTDTRYLPVRGDALLLRESLNNLLDNAIKYHPGGGVITLSVNAGPEPAVSVVDDGPGIPAALREKVFTRFHRGDRNGSVEGSGLGLSIVQDIAQVHGGSVSLDAGPGGHGLCVRLRLPALVKQPVAAI